MNERDLKAATQTMDEAQFRDFIFAVLTKMTRELSDANKRDALKQRLIDSHEHRIEMLEAVRPQGIGNA